jgi:electron transfer flavoprotein alpha subunit
VRNSDAVKCLTVRPTAFDKAEATGGDAAVSELAFGADGKSPAFVSADVKQSDRPDLTAANVVIAGGRGMKNGENL